MKYSVKSFNVDHTVMDVGLYNRGFDKYGITTWDVRFFKPNVGDYFKPESCHTIEHYMATYFRKIFRDKIVYVGPMGCMTGFYILSKHLDRDDIIKGLIGVHKYINSDNNIPGNSEESCGNYKFHDYNEAVHDYNTYYEEFLKEYELKLCENIIHNGLGGSRNES